MNDYELFYEPNPDQAELRVIENGLNEFDRTEFGRSGYRSFTFLFRDSEGSIAGGIHGNSGALWAYVSALWVAEDLRGNGYGGQLLRAAEAEVVKRGCRNCYLDTYNPRAFEFYKKSGYVVFGELEEFYPGGKRYFMKKCLLDPKTAMPLETHTRR